jgi:DNA/RNA endonuclease YhcR with UshA esterase domain
VKHKYLVSLFASFCLLAATAPADAHHAFAAEFDANKPLKITGTVTKVEWQNPHTRFYIDVADERGGIASWSMELASPNLLMRSGWTATTMKIGDVVTVEGFHAKNGSPNGNARVVTLNATGERLFAGPTSGRVQP